MSFFDKKKGCSTDWYVCGKWSDCFFLIWLPNPKRHRYLLFCNQLGLIQLIVNRFLNIGYVTARLYGIIWRGCDVWKDFCIFGVWCNPKMVESNWKHHIPIPQDLFMEIIRFCDRDGNYVQFNHKHYKAKYLFLKIIRCCVRDSYVIVCNATW